MALKFLLEILCFVVIVSPKVFALENSDHYGVSKNFDEEENQRHYQKRLIRRMLEQAAGDDLMHDFFYSAKLVMDAHEQSIFGAVGELLTGSEVEEEFLELRTFSEQKKRVNNLRALAERILVDTEAIHKKAHELGFYDSAVKYKMRMKKSKNTDGNRQPKKRLYVTFHVDFGKRFKLKLNLRYVGKDANFQARFRKKLNDEMATFTSSIADMKALIDEAVRDLRRKGYYNPEVKEKRVWLDYNRKEAVLNLTIDPGNKVNFGGVSIHAFDGIDPKFVENRTSWEKGEEFNIERLEETTNDLNSTQIFSKVKVEPEYDKATKSEVPISITVKKDKKHTVDFSLLYSGVRSMNFEKKSNAKKSLKSIIARISWTNFNTFGGAERLRITVEGSPMRVKDRRSDYAFEVALAQPDVFWRNNAAEYVISRRQELTNVFFQKSDKLSLIFSYPLWYFSAVRFGMIAEGNYVDFAEGYGNTNRMKDADKSREKKKEEEEKKEEDEAKIDEENRRKKYRDFTIPLELIFDRTDDPLNPTRGYKFLISYAYLKFQKTKNIDHLQALGTAFSYNIPLDKVKKNILAFNVSYRMLLGKSVDNIPLDKRLYAGGMGSVRGYANQMATDAIKGKDMVMGGKSSLEFNTEFRRKFTKDFGGVLFFDGARVFQNHSKDEGMKIEKKRWFYSFGFGIRYFTGIGPIRADFAFPIRRRKKIDSRMQFILSLGQAF